VAKRFTDVNKWGNKFFDELDIKGKLTWIYLCDQCESSGIWKSNYKLASFQLGFKIMPELLAEWFGEKIYFIDDEKILVVQFFEFQYGETKDTWSAKIKAKNVLESYGFIIENNKLINPKLTHSPPTVGVQSCTVLSISNIKSISKSISNIKYDFEKNLFAIPQKNWQGRWD
jgi:hypothetical protein